MNVGPVCCTSELREVRQNEAEDPLATRLPITTKILSHAVFSIVADCGRDGPRNGAPLLRVPFDGAGVHWEFAPLISPGGFAKSS
jgi:hypothetical protein